MRTPSNASRASVSGVIRFAIAAIYIVPLVWLILNSLKLPGIMPPTPSLWPDPISWSNYTQVFSLYAIGQQFLNSLFVVAIAVPLTLLAASWAGFAMAMLPARARRRLVTLTVVLMVIPLPALWLPRFVIFTWVGLNDNLLALILPALMGSSPFFVLLFHWTFRR